MDEPNNLLACPFCGVAAKTWIHYPPDNVWQAGCRNEVCHVMPNTSASGEENAVQLWNRRAGGMARGATEGSRLGAVSQLDGARTKKGDRVKYALSKLLENEAKIESFFSVDIQREHGRSVPTITIIKDRDVTEEQDKRLREAMWEIGNVVKEIYAQPSNGADERPAPARENKEGKAC